MAGSVQGGKKAAATNKAQFGEDWYSRIGALGGRKSRGGGFSRDRDLASRAGAIGGALSRRGKIKLSEREKKQIRKDTLSRLERESQASRMALSAKYGQARPW